MQDESGYMRRLTPEQPQRADEVFVPEKEEEAVVNMNRQQRRAWAREERKRLARASHA